MTGCDVVTGRGRACKNNKAGIKAESVMIFGLIFNFTKIYANISKIFLVLSLSNVPIILFYEYKTFI